MENASKALLIAGSVLVAIVLISIGILLLNGSKDITNQSSELSNSMTNTAKNKVTQMNLNNL